MIGQAATVRAVDTRPDPIRAVVAISPHMEAETSPAAALPRLAILTLLRGPWAGAPQGRLYRSWFKTSPPHDLERHVAPLQAMLTDRRRRRAVRETLVAHRKGMAEMMESSTGPSLIVFGSADDYLATILQGLQRAEEDAIHAVRALRSALHGFVTFEIHQGLGLAVSTDKSFEKMIDTFISGIVST